MNKSQDTLLDGKVCLVTGASRGIGFWTAHGLAARGAHVILIGHHQGRGESALSTLQTKFGTAAARFIKTDLSDQDAIHGMAQEIKQRYPALHVLVNNAGGFFLTRRESTDGIEMTFALNHLNYFMTTLLLLDLLLQHPEGRIVNVSSNAHRGQKMRFHDLQFEDGYNGLNAYGQSKLANLLFTYELSRRLQDQSITVNALHPGFVHTHLGKHHWLIRPFLEVIHLLFAKSPQEGAQTPIYLASSPVVEGVSGKYYVDQEPVPSSRASRSQEDARRLWEISERMTGLNSEDYLP